MIADQISRENTQQEVIDWLAEQRFAALPVAPAQPAEKYPAKEKDGSVRRDKAGNPVPAFTGKNPSYLDRNGIPHLVYHTDYQRRLPTAQELKIWFANPGNGVGTLGGWNKAIWLDLDVKQFSSKEECDRVFWAKLEAYPELAQTFIEETHSGGWRIGVRVRDKPNFTNFALAPGGKHVGEALGEGRFTVLAPTIGPSGNSYKSINRVQLVEVESLESIGIYPASNKIQRQAQTVGQPNISYIPGSIPLEQLGNEESRHILKGACPTGDRSEALATALQEWYGWRNWSQENGIGVAGTPEDLAHHAGQHLGIDSDRVNRIIKTIDPASCRPAALHRGSEESCWKKIRRLDKATFEAQCPAHIKDSIKREWNISDKPTGRSFGGGIGSGGGGGRRSNGGSGGSGDGGDGGLKAVSLYQRVEEVLKRELPDSQQIEALIKVAQNEGVTRSDVESIAKEILAEKERWADLTQDSPQFKKLVGFREQDLNLSEVFPTDLAKAFLTKAHSSRLDPIRLVQNLLPACGAVLGASVCVVAKRGATERDHWYEHPIFWTVDVAAPSSGKSDAQRACFDPLKEMEKEAFKRVDEAKRRLAIVDAKWKSLCEEEREEKRGTDADPEFFKSEYVDKVRRYLWDEATIEALFRLISEQAPGAGTAWVKDELEALFKGLDQHKSGNKGNALQQLLSSWSGPLWGTIDRVDKTKSFRMSGQTLNISGTIQPDVFINRVNVRDDPNGLISRLLPAMSKLPEGFSKWSDVRVDLFDCIADLLKGLEQMGGTCEFSPQAHILWISQWEKLRRGYESYLESNPAFAYFLGKQCSYVPRLALLLHCIEHHYAPKADFTHIGLDTLKKAIILSDYYCGQFRLLQAASFTKDEFPLEGLLFKVWEKVKALGKMAARDICQFARRYKWHGKKITAGTAVEILATIRDAGYGVLQGKTLYFKSPDNPPPPPPGVGNVDQMLINDQQAQSLEESGFQGFVDQVDQHPDKNLENESTGVVASGFSFTPPNDQPDQQMAESPSHQALEDVDQVYTFDQHCQQESGDTLEVSEVSSTDSPSDIDELVTTVVEEESSPAVVEPDDLAVPATSIQPEDIVRFLNPGNLPKSRKFENLDLKVKKIAHAGLAFCQLPDGREATFGINTLQKVEKQSLSLRLDDTVESQAEGLEVGDRVFVAQWPHTDRLGPYSIQQIEGEYAKVECFPMLLKIVDLRKE